MKNLKITNIKYNNQISTFYFENNKLKNITSGLEARCDFDAQEASVSVGWVDSHVHIAPNLVGFASDADDSGINQGVTTLVDAGSTGWGNYKIMEEYADKTETDLFYLINISKNGLTRLDELKDSSLFNKEESIKVFKNQKRVLGYKVRLSGSVLGDNYDEAHSHATQLSDEANAPLVAHIGNEPLR